MHDVVLSAGNPQLNVSPTRNVRAESGYGTLARTYDDRFPAKPAKITRAGKTVRPWGQSSAKSEKKDLISPNKGSLVLVKSANTSPAQIGFPAAYNWGIAGATVNPPNVEDIQKGATAALAIAVAVAFGVIWLTRGR